MRANVVFQQPLSPTTANVSPAPTEKLTPSNAVNRAPSREKRRRTPRITLAQLPHLYEFAAIPHARPFLMRLRAYLRTFFPAGS
jgi:hypothetical protein